MDLAALAVGLAAGVLGGMTGLGGGVIVVPLLVYFFHMTQHEAQGTSLAVLLPPIGLLAFLEYYRAGHVSIRVAVLVALGFILGGYLGGYAAQLVPDRPLRRIFALLLLGVAIDLLRR
jgi:uncharacterized membrane protein YfcA